MDTIYHVAAPNGTTFGQMTQDEIIAKSASGELPADALIWAEGMADWQPASTLCPPPVNEVPWGMISALKSVYFSRYFDFRGRACRSEYWFSMLGVNLLATAYIVILLMATYEPKLPVDVALAHAAASVIMLGALPAVLFCLYAVIPGISLTVRRLHDIGLSGWFYLLSFVPYIGCIFLFICGLLPSAGPNRWGARPEGPAE